MKKIKIYNSIHFNPFGVLRRSLGSPQGFRVSARLRLIQLEISPHPILLTAHLYNSKWFWISGNLIDMIVFIVDLSTGSVNFILSFNHVNEQKLYFVWHSENAKWEGDERSEARMDLGFCKTFGSETLPHISTADRQEHPHYWWFNPDFLKMELNGRWRKKYVLIFVHTVLTKKDNREGQWQYFFVHKINQREK